MVRILNTFVPYRIAPISLDILLTHLAFQCKLTCLKYSFRTLDTYAFYHALPKQSPTFRDVGRCILAYNPYVSQISSIIERDTIIINYDF